MSTLSWTGSSDERKRLAIVAGVAGAIGLATVLCRRQRANEGGDSSSSSSSNSGGSSKQPPLFAATSSTAQATALMRYLCPEFKPKSEDIPVESSEGEAFGADEFALYFLSAEQRLKAKSPKFKSSAISQFHEKALGLCQWLWSRTRAIDHQMYRIASGAAGPRIQQVVILGAGFDTRCYRFNRLFKDETIACFEVDLPEIQQIKRDAMLKIQSHEQRDFGLDRVTFVPLDLSLPAEQLQDAMSSAGFHANLRTLWIWEGVTAYLTAESVQSSLRFMSDSCTASSTLLATFLSPENLSTDGRAQMQRALAAKKEPHRFHPQAVEFDLMMAEANWTSDILFNPQRLENDYLSVDEGKAWPGAYLTLGRREGRE